MRIPTIHGVIARRILANYQVDPDVLGKILPSPFRPKLVKGVGIGGICLIRLKQLKPQFISGHWGLSSENAAHRFAVEWTENNQVHEGVYIPRRDTSSRFKTLVGGRLFPGVHNHAQFHVVESDRYYRVALDSKDDQTHVLVEGQVDTCLPPTSIFTSLPEASAFFEAGAVGYSVTPRVGEYDGLELRTLAWRVEPLHVDNIESSFFEDEQRFPPGSLRFDCALLMRDIQHEWHSRAPLCSLA